MNKTNTPKPIQAGDYGKNDTRPEMDAAEAKPKDKNTDGRKVLALWSS